MQRTPSLFTRASKGTARLAGRPSTFGFMVLLVLAWALSGPYFHFSDTWQLVINTGTTVLTFLMVFLIQATQNRDAEAIQIKLDEIIRAIDGAHNTLMDLEDLEEEELLKLHGHYLRLAERARGAVKSGKPDTGVPELEVERRRRAAQASRPPQSGTV